MILLFALALGAVLGMVVGSGDRREGRGCFWFWMWALASAVFVFAIATGFSVGLFIAPFAIALFVWVGHRSPHGAEALGALVGFGADLVLFGQIDAWRAGTLVGSASMLAGVSGYAALLVRRRERCVS